MDKLTRQSFSKRDCCRKYTDPKYQPPTKQDLEDFLTLTSINKRVLADTIGVFYDSEKGSGSPTIRRWFKRPDHKEHREISYANWHLLLLEFGIVEPAIK